MIRYPIILTSHKSQFDFLAESLVFFKMVLIVTSSWEGDGCKLVKMSSNWKLIELFD